MPKPVSHPHGAGSARTNPRHFAKTVAVLGTLVVWGIVTGPVLNGSYEMNQPLAVGYVAAMSVVAVYCMVHFLGRINRR